MQIPTVSVRDLSAAAVELVSSAAPGFEDLVRALAPRAADALLLCRPQLAVLTNRSSSTIVAYAIQFIGSRGSLVRSKATTHGNYPDAVAESAGEPDGIPRGLEVRPGEQRVVTRQLAVSGELDDAHSMVSDYCREERRELGRIDRMDLVLDAVVFDDGLVVGPNESRMDEHFMAYVAATQAVYRGIVAQLDGGASVDEALRAVESGLPVWNPSTYPDVIDASMYSSLAMGKAVRWRHVYRIPGVVPMLDK